MIPVTILLCDPEGHVSSDLAEVAGALNEQVHADFAPVWHGHATHATVMPWFRDEVPDGTWAVIVKKELDEPGALGYHADYNNQPYAYVDVDDGEWSVTASHEILEMLADPWGNRMHTARHPRGLDPKDIGLRAAVRRVQYLVEVCDPPEATAYEVGGVKVSDFVTPDWYRTAEKAGTPYSAVGGCTLPRQVSPGGYVSFHVGGNWWQLTNFSRLRLHDLGRFDRTKFASLREFSDAHLREFRGLNA
jgi:hypothetical protein